MPFFLATDFLGYFIEFFHICWSTNLAKPALCCCETSEVSGLLQIRQSVCLSKLKRNSGPASSRDPYILDSCFAWMIQTTKFCVFFLLTLRIGFSCLLRACPVWPPQHSSAYSLYHCSEELLQVPGTKGNVSMIVLTGLLSLKTARLSSAA